MNIEEALRWVDNNCYDEATVQRLRSRKVARTLADEIKWLRDAMENAVNTNHFLLEELEKSRDNDRCTFGYLSEIRNIIGHDGDFPSLIEVIKQMK